MKHFSVLIVWFVSLFGYGISVAQTRPKIEISRAVEADSLTQRNYDGGYFHGTIFKKKVFLPDIQFKTELKFDTVTFKDIVSFYNFDANANHYTNFLNDVTFDSCIFKKRVNFDFSAFRAEVRLNNCVFDSFVNFYKTEYQGLVNMSNLRFNYPVRAVQASFHGALHAERVVFADTADFSGYSMFLSWVAFKNCGFAKETDFSFDNFSKDLDFMNNRLSGPVSFANTVFGGTTQILADTFKSILDFTSAIINGETKIDTCMISGANFSNATINARLSFNDDYFVPKSKLVFNHAVLKDNAYMSFNRTRLPDTLDFSYINNITNEIDLSDAELKDNVIHYIYLTNSNISKFHLNYRNFKLAFVDDTNRSMNSRYEEKNRVYQDLLKNFLARGQEDSWALLDVEYQDFVWEWKWGAAHLSWVRIFPHYWNNYGQSKSRVFLWTIAFLILFTSFTFLYLHVLNKEVYKIDTLPADLNKWSNCKNSRQVLDHSWNSLVYTSAVFLHIVISMDKLYFKRSGLAIYILFMYFIGVLCLAFMAGCILNQ